MTSPWCPTPPSSPQPHRRANRSPPPSPRPCGVTPTAAGSTSSTTRSSADGPKLVHVPRQRSGHLATVIEPEGEIRCATTDSELTTTQPTIPRRPAMTATVRSAQIPKVGGELRLVDLPPVEVGPDQ